VALLSQTPPSPTSTLTPTSTVTLTPSPLTPSLTPTPSPLSSSPTPTLSPTPLIGSTQISPLDGMVLMYIPACTFQMGSENGIDDEMPVHTVTLDAFWMDQTEVTNAMYALCVADGDCSPPDSDTSSLRDGYYTGAGYADYPVIYVDWSQAAAYCGWAGRQLPTEAQWEYAARGGLVGALYPWGDDFPSCALGAENGAQYTNCSLNDTIAVGGFAPNGYGLYDMAGNVWEWVADWYGPYSSAAVENPSGPEFGNDRALRGGAWRSVGISLRVSSHSGSSPDNTNYSFGFRCSLSVTLGF